MHVCSFVGVYLNLRLINESLIIYKCINIYYLNLFTKNHSHKSKVKIKLELPKNSVHEKKSISSKKSHSLSYTNIELFRKDVHF